MKGKSVFSQAEASKIEELIKLKLNASTVAQKGIRNKIRALKFYASDFNLGGGYTVADFRRVTTIVGQNKVISSTINTETKTIPKAEQFTNDFSDKVQLTLDHSKEIISQLKHLNFQGFVTIKSVKESNYKDLSTSSGIYVILHAFDQPNFLKIGTGGFFKMKNPNVNLDELATNWVQNTPIVYIGKAGGGTSSATIKTRLKQYFGFGEGKNVGHWGGRYIWQLANADELIVCWLPLPNDIPAEVESALIKKFTNYHGKRPFANLKD